MLSFKDMYSSSVCQIKHSDDLYHSYIPLSFVSHFYLLVKFNYLKDNRTDFVFKIYYGDFGFRSIFLWLKNRLLNPFYFKNFVYSKNITKYVHWYIFSFV